MEPGVLVFHPQLGAGKVLSNEKGKLQVAFLFFWPTVLVQEDQVKMFIPSEAFKGSVNELARFLSAERQQ